MKQSIQLGMVFFIVVAHLFTCNMDITSGTMSN